MFSLQHETAHLHWLLNLRRKYEAHRNEENQNKHRIRYSVTKMRITCRAQERAGSVPLNRVLPRFCALSGEYIYARILRIPDRSLFV